MIGKRLREGKKNAKQTARDPETQSSHNTQIIDHCHRAPEATPRLTSLGAFDLIPCSGDITVPSSSRSLSCYPSSIGQASTMSYERPYPLTVFGALYVNGQILGLSCNVVSPVKSSPVSSDVPLPLQPTPTQLLIVHFTWIDRFPFPKMRDNIINLSFIIDEEEFSRDIFTMPCFSITPGAAPWDPRAWKIEKPFADKWGFLFY